MKFIFEKNDSLKRNGVYQVAQKKFNLQGTYDIIFSHTKQMIVFKNKKVISTDPLLELFVNNAKC